MSERPKVGDFETFDFAAQAFAYMDELEAENREYKATNLDLRRQITDCRNFHQKLEAENRELRADATGFEAQAYWLGTRLTEAERLLQMYLYAADGKMSFPLDETHAFLKEES